MSEISFERRLNYKNGIDPSHFAIGVKKIFVTTLDIKNGDTIKVIISKIRTDKENMIMLSKEMRKEIYGEKI